MSCLSRGAKEFAAARQDRESLDLVRTQHEVSKTEAY